MYDLNLTKKFLIFDEKLDKKKYQNLNFPKHKHCLL